MRSFMLFISVCLAVSGLFGVAVDAKQLKKKYVGETGDDFEFIDEINKNSQINAKNANEQRKRWIHDPTSDLCRPLNCKKREICLLEHEYSAACVSKKDLHKNRDVIVTRAKYLEEQSKRRANQLQENDDNESDDNDNFDDDRSSFSAPAGAGNADMNGNANADADADESSKNAEDDVFYDNTIASDKDDDDELDNCKPCAGNNKPTFLCGTDNRTYSSLCRLDYHNCIHSTSIRIACKGFCPCRDNNIDGGGKRLQRLNERQNALNAKYKKTMEQQQQAYKEQSNNNILSNAVGGAGIENDNNEFNTIMNDKDDNNQHYNHINAQYTFTPEDIKYDNKHYKYLKYTTYKQDAPRQDQEKQHKSRNFNEVVEKQPTKFSKYGNNAYPSKSSECKPQQLTAIGNRLLDWFSVIMADSKKRRQHNQKSKAHFPPACKAEAKWMFGHLDLNNDAMLSMQEMYDLEHDQNERCIKPFIDTCDLDHDNSINTREWCRCFEKTDRPCAAVRRRIAGDFAGEIGAYAPDCDVQGFYKPTQCHNSVGVCWCVDKHGVEFANTRTRGKPNCDSVVNNAASLISDDEDIDTDDEDSAEGSADQMLIF